MQISQVKERELGMLISGLRAIGFSDPEHSADHSRLLVQLETELSTRYGMAIGTPAEQERNRVALEAPAKRKYTRRAKSKK